MEPGTDIDVSRTTHWLTASAVVVFVCGILAIVLPLTFSIGVAELLGWLFIFAAVAHLIFGIHFASGTLGWHAFIAALYVLAAINLLVNPLLGVVLLALVIGVVLVAEGIIEIVLFFILREYRLRCLDLDRWSCHFGPRDRRLRTLATCQSGVGSVPCGNQFYFERDFPFVAGFRNSRDGANGDSGCLNQKQSVRTGVASVRGFCSNYK